MLRETVKGMGRGGNCLNLGMVGIHAEKSDNITSYDFELDNMDYYSDYVHLTPAGSVAFTNILYNNSSMESSGCSMRLI